MPASGLVSGQIVSVSGSGFSPSEGLVVTECAAKGVNTGMGDCNLDAIVTTSSDPSGHVQVNFTVSKGPFGSNQIVCGAQQRCLVSVTQATLAPKEEADTPISFR